jgi:hypothetical protein
MRLVVGIITAVLFCGVIIWSIEHSYSFWEILVGFISAILPIVLLSAIRSNVAVFFVLSFAILLGYFSYKFEHYSVGIGVILALIVGIPIHYFRVRKTTVE